jgi:hypothetical protein
MPAAENFRELLAVALLIGSRRVPNAAVSDMHTYITSPNVPRLDIPPTSELFSKEALVERHPNLLTYPRVQWALRNRARNGLSSVVYESKSGQLLVHEPEFLRWYLGLTGRSKPRASRVLRRSAGTRSLEES